MDATAKTGVVHRCDDGPHLIVFGTFSISRIARQSLFAIAAGSMLWMRCGVGERVLGSASAKLNTNTEVWPHGREHDRRIEGRLSRGNIVGTIDEGKMNIVAFCYLLF